MVVNKEVVVAVISFIDVVTQRGAIRGEELAPVSDLRKYFVEYGQFLVNAEKKAAEEQKVVVTTSTDSSAN